MQKKCLGRKNPPFAVAIFVVQCARHNAGGLSWVRGDQSLGLRLNWLAQCYLHCTKVGLWSGLSHKWVTDIISHPCMLVLVFPENRDILCNDNTIIIPRDWYSNQIQTAQLSRNVSFMCVLYTQAFISFYLVLKSWSHSGSPLACSHRVPLIFFTPEPIPAPVLFAPFLEVFKVQAYLVMFYNLDLFGYFFMIELDFFGESDVCFLSLVHIMPPESLVMLNSNI